MPEQVSVPSSSRSRAQFTLEEKRKIFRGMVVGELEAGFLRYSRRQALIQYAAKLGINEFEATLLIAEAQYKSDQLEAVSFDTVATFDTVARPEMWSMPLRITFAIVAAAIVDLAVIY